MGHFDLAYLDPPYNQHRYFTNYHVWETLVAWDVPEAYGVARKRLDARDPSTHSVFNSKKTMPAALASVVQSVDCDLLVLSYNNESWLGLEELEAMCSMQNPGTEPGTTGGTARTRELATLAFDWLAMSGPASASSTHPGGRSAVWSHLSNQELIVIAGEPALVRRVVEAAEGGATSVGTASNHPLRHPVRSPWAWRDRLQQAT